MTSKNTSVLTGIKPTGIPHIGNYLGAIAPALKRASEFRHAFFFIADYHALNSVSDPKLLKDLTRSVAATWLAAGLDLSKVHFYRQSDIPEIFELETILTNITPKGWMNKMHAYKAQVDINRAANQPVDSGISMGLYTYPLLMACDILIFNAEIVPVGSDQVQHVEIARDIAGRFNKEFATDALTLPEFVLEDGVKELPGVDGRKMSKSYGNTIPLFANRDGWDAAVKKIVTDSGEHTPESFRETTFYKIFSAIADQKDTDELVDKFVSNKINWKAAKDQLTEQLVAQFTEPSLAYNELMQDPEKIDSILRQGADDIRPLASKTLESVKEAIGVI